MGGWSLLLSLGLVLGSAPKQERDVLRVLLGGSQTVVAAASDDPGTER